MVIRDVTFEEASMMKLVDSGQTKEVSKRVESDNTPLPLDSLVSFQFSPEVTQDGEHITDESCNR